MRIIGRDFHTRYQQIAMLDDSTGELIERRLEHLNGEAASFYSSLPQPVRVGVEATGRRVGRVCHGARLYDVRSRAFAWKIV